MLSLFLFIVLLSLVYYVSYINKDRVVHLNEKFTDQTYSRNINYQSEIENTENQLNMQIQDPQERIYHHIKLWKLYYDGIPDRYDLDGNSIPGVEPNPELALYHINEAINNGYKEGYFELAKMYHFGFHNFDENKEEAKQIYTYIIDNNFPKKKEALENLQTIVDEERYQSMSSWLNIPTDSIKKYLGNDSFSYVDRKQHMQNVQQVKSQQREYRRQNQQPVEIGIFYKNPEDKRFIDIELKDRTQQPIRNTIKNDSQNVHDSALIRTVRQSIENLQNSTNLSINHGDSLRELRGYILSKPDCDRKINALRTLDAMERTHEPLVSFKMKEVDLLNLVWNRINNNHSENKEDLMENLYDQLANGVEHDKVVCTTGRFTRVLDSLNVIDDQVAIKPRSLINRELMDKSAMIRKEMYDAESYEAQQRIDSIQDNETQIEFTEKLKNTIRRQFYNDYVRTEVLTQDELDEEVNKWIDYI